MIQPFSVLWAILAMQNDDYKDNGEIWRGRCKNER